MYLQTLEITWNYFPRTDSRERVDADPLGVKQPWTFFRPSGRLYIYTFSHGGACKWNFARGPSGRWCLPGSWETRACLHTYTRAAGRWRFLQFLFLSPFSRDERETLTAVDRSCGCRCTMKSEKVKSRRPDGKLKGSTNLYISARNKWHVCFSSSCRIRILIRPYEYSQIFVFQINGCLSRSLFTRSYFIIHGQRMRKMLFCRNSRARGQQTIDITSASRGNSISRADSAANTKKKEKNRERDKRLNILARL